MTTPGMTNSKKKKSRLNLTPRDDAILKNVKLNDRDDAILKHIYFRRALTEDQLYNILYFGEEPGKYVKKSMNRRLGQLVESKYLFLCTSSPDVYRIDERAAWGRLPKLLKVEEYEIDWSKEELKTSDIFLEHLIKTNDVRIAIENACRHRGWSIDTWIDDKTLKSEQMKDYVEITGLAGSTQRAAVVPDSYCRLVIPPKDPQYPDDDYRRDHPRCFDLFIEIDLSHVTGKSKKWRARDWARKVQAYLAYHRSGLYKKRYHTNKMRVLTVTTTQKHLEYLKGITEKHGGKKRFWYTTFDAVFDAVKLKPDAVLTEPISAVSSLDELCPLIRP